MKFYSVPGRAADFGQFGNFFNNSEQNVRILPNDLLLIEALAVGTATFCSLTKLAERIFKLLSGRALGPLWDCFETAQERPPLGSSSLGSSDSTQFLHSTHTVSW